MDLWSIVKGVQVSANIAFTSECESLLRDFIQKGDAELKRHADKDLDLEAEINLRSFLAEMINRAQQMRLTTLDNSIFLSVKNKLCPLFPFC